ncbi:MAG: hypothetical protein FD138_3162 [Planctomycetota bacterium]|nr:MAG: hypothetical protein FD138_3162 [Planctomycetota bacterium]
MKRTGADLACREQDLHIAHHLSRPIGDRLFVLSSASFFDSDCRFNTAHLLTSLGPGETEQHCLPALSSALAERKLYITSFERLGEREWAVGASKQVVAPTDGITCGLFVLDVLNPASPIRFHANAGSRFRVASDGAVFSTLHHNLETRHSVTFDDGLCLWQTSPCPNWNASKPGSCTLLAYFGTERALETPWLSSRKTRESIPDLLKWNAFRVFTDHIEPLPSGEVLMSVWNTAQNTVQNFTFVIVRRDGSIETTFEDIEPRSRMAYSQRKDWFINIGESQSKVFDRTGRLLARRDNGTSSRQRHKRFLLQSISPDFGLAMSSPWWAQTNTVLQVDEPVMASPDAYFSTVIDALAEHDKWVRQKARKDGVLYFRFVQ